MPSYKKPPPADSSSADDPNYVTRMLIYGNDGTPKKNYYNLRMIFAADPMLRSICYNRLSGAIEVYGDLPWPHESAAWCDTDDARLYDYITCKYGEFPMSLFPTALTSAADDNSFHPIVSWLTGLEDWDRVPRLETLLIDYLGAEDTPYVRAVTRKLLRAAVMRLIEPGKKFDNILVLCGPQGIGKSTLISRLGGDWYSDSLSLSDMNDKTAAEKLQGYWILEISEMAGMKKAELEKVKSFLSRTDDKYREPYGRRVVSHPRTCVFVGTTNAEDGFLRDRTGNRRFWTVPVTGKGKYKPWDLDEKTVRQIWMEALIGSVDEPLYLEGELLEQAEQAQRESLEQDDRAGLVRDYLALKLPDEWEELTLEQRRRFVRDPDSPYRRGAFRTRATVSNMEIWCECFGREREDLNRKMSGEITMIMNTLEGWKRTESIVKLPLYGYQRVYCQNCTN